MVPRACQIFWRGGCWGRPKLFRTGSELCCSELVSNFQTGSELQAPHENNTHKQKWLLVFPNWCFQVSELQLVWNQVFRTKSSVSNCSNWLPRRYALRLCRSCRSCFAHETSMLLDLRSMYFVEFVNVSDVRVPWYFFKMLSLCSNVYASKTRIKILWKKTCCIAPMFFLSPMSLVIPGAIEPWPKKTCRIV